MEPLNFAEKEELLLLLGLSTWGSLTEMRRAYHKKCLIFHPDKGGDEERMKRLNALFKRMESTCPETQSQEGASASASAGASWSSEVCREMGDTYVRRVGVCNIFPSGFCKCLMCTLRRCHIIRSRHKRLAWSKCYCYECFISCYAHPNTPASVERWKHVLRRVPFSHLQIF
ncbi:small T antigen [Lemniscomys striatus polyomavirus 1]|nr:small T antigen [Lemniscomys striatus polyomavirus 1]